MLRALLTIGALLLLLLTPLPAGAQGRAGAAFGDQGQAIVSVDRLMPLFAYESYKQGFFGGGGTNNQTVTSISLVGHGVSAYSYGGVELGALFYNIPRFAFDYTVWQHLTVGGSVWAYFQLGNSTTHTENGVSVTNDNGKVTFWGIAPRVGWILQLSDVFSFWPRGGVSFNDAGVTFPPANPGLPSGGGTVTQWAIDLEPMFVITPVPHAGFTVGPAVDIPFAGSLSTSNAAGTTVSVDSTQFHFGITAGLLAWF
jgi:hypothetical protein